VGAGEREEARRVPLTELLPRFLPAPGIVAVGAGEAKLADVGIAVAIGAGAGHPGEAQVAVAVETGEVAVGGHQLESRLPMVEGQGLGEGMPRLGAVALAARKGQVAVGAEGSIARSSARRFLVGWFLSQGLVGGLLTQPDQSEGEDSQRADAGELF
jgi:hypothetical protein